MLPYPPRGTCSLLLFCSSFPSLFSPFIVSSFLLCSPGSYGFRIHLRRIHCMPVVCHLSLSFRAEILPFPNPTVLPLVPSASHDLIFSLIFLRMFPYRPILTHPQSLPFYPYYVRGTTRAIARDTCLFCTFLRVLPIAILRRPIIQLVSFLSLYASPLP